MSNGNPSQVPAGLAPLVEAQTGSRLLRAESLGGGPAAQVYRLHLSDGEDLVAKVADAAMAGAGQSLVLEGFMLGYLRRHSHLPVPRVIHSDRFLLLMENLPGGGPIDRAAQVEAAEMVAHLHMVEGPSFGFQRDTAIGGLPQPNPESDLWLPFFRDQRLMHMGRLAMEAGQLPADLMGRLETLCGRLDRWLVEPAKPSLIHGDMWTGNVLVHNHRISGFVDPAIYFADPEIELAFTTLFGTFGDAFFDRYREIRPIAPDFFKLRRHLYNLYPLLVHARLFGGGYVASVERTLARFGA